MIVKYLAINIMAMGFGLTLGYYGTNFISHLLSDKKEEEESKPLVYHISELTDV